MHHPPLDYAAGVCALHLLFSSLFLPVLWSRRPLHSVWYGSAALSHTNSKETIKNLLELSDTETYKGVPAKHALILWLSALRLYKWQRV